MEIQVTYRRTSRLSLRIGRYGEVRVSAPYGYPQEAIEKFIEEKREWIAKAQERTRERFEKRNEFYSQLPLTTKEDFRKATERMTAIILPLVDKYMSLMGVFPSEVKYKATISKLGSC